MEKLELEQEFERQVQNLLEKKYPEAAGMPTDDFLNLVMPLKEKIKTFQDKELDIDVENGRLPFIIVIKGSLVPSEKAMAITEKDGKNGVTILRPLSAENFTAIGEVTLPQGPAYLLTDIDRGKDSINIPPQEALLKIKSSGRTPLTIDEGIALVTHFPAFLMKNNCFSLLASRTGKDKRVPAIWINAQKQPNLGWCWDGNPHTWLGSASAAGRIGV